MSKTICIRDPVYNYIYLTQFESKLLAHPLFQRLRFILQNGVAYYTYPSNKTCRFLHSLGTMKIAGDIFLKSTEDIHSPFQKEFLEKAYDMILERCRVQTVNIVQLGSLIGRAGDKTQIRYGLYVKIELSDRESEIPIEKKNLLAKNILFQSLRLAALLHDLGHFPMSHIMENALLKHLEFSVCLEKAEEDVIYKNLVEPFAKSKHNPQIHENIGSRLLNIIMPSTDDDYHKMCRHFAELILNKNATLERTYSIIIEPLRGIISGELDSDRLDYTLRDPLSSGLELGAFDIERLVKNYTLYNDNGNYMFLPKIQALSSIECFYHQRYLVYKYLIFHHSKVRMDEMVCEITLILVNIYNRALHGDGYEKIYGILRENKFNYIWEGFMSDGNDFFYCNDYWYHSLLQKIQMEIVVEGDANNELKRLNLLLNTFLFRKTANMLSLFKRYDRYNEFLEKIRDEVSDDDNKFFKKIHGVIRGQYLLPKFEKVKKLIYEEYGVVVVLSITIPRLIEFDEEGQSILKIVQESSKEPGTYAKHPVSVYSPYLESLNTMRYKDLAFHIFLYGEDVKSKEDTVEVIKAEVLKFFINTYKEV